MIALIWNAPVRLVDTTVRYELFVEGLRAAGSDGLAICPIGCEVGYDYPVRTFRDERELTQPQYWRELGCTGAAIVNWHRMTNILTALREAAIPVVSLSDSDGQVSPRFSPGATFTFMTAQQTSWRNWLGTSKHWLTRFLFSAAEHRALVANVAASDVYTLPGEGCVAEFRRLLGKIGGAALATRVQWLPYPVPTSFCTCPIIRSRPDRIIAVGRWDSIQKDPRLLERALRIVLAHRPSMEIFIVGKGGEGPFGPLRQRFPGVRVLGVQPREEVRRLMAECRLILFSSKWEGSPVAANEMLALGGTVVGTPIPSLRGITANGAFGRTSRNHSPASLAEALRDELAAWDRGERDPQVIASAWRARVSPIAVAERLLQMLCCHRQEIVA